MRYKIQNEYLSVEADEIGGELSSVKSLKTGTEYLWQGDEKYWKGRAYNMFPFNGRIFGGKYIYRGKEYEMPVHGIVRRTPLEGSSDGKTMKFVLRSDENFKRIYPFDFTYAVKYSLNKNSLVVTFSAENSGSERMYFGFGMHPGFNVPFDDGKKFEDYTVAFSGKSVRRRIMSENVLATDKTEAYSDMKLRHDLFDNDAVMLQNTGGKAVLSCGKKALEMEYSDFGYIGLWHKAFTDAPYVCFEPMTMLPGPEGKTAILEEFPGIIGADPGEVVTRKIMIKILE